MTRLRVSRVALHLAVGGLLGLALAACGSGGGPGWTYAPAPSATPAASGSEAPAGSGAPAGSEAPSDSVAPSTEPNESAPSGTTVTIVASTFEHFDTPEVSAKAGQPFMLVFDNKDTTAPHNVVIQQPGGGDLVEMAGDTTPFTGPGERTYDLPALPAGQYPFLCQVHPTTMTGTLTIE